MRRLAVFVQHLGILLCLLLALGSLWGGNVIFRRYTQAEKQQQNKSAVPNIPMPLVAHKGVWEWRSPETMSDTMVADNLDFLAAQGINTVYLGITSYIDYYELSDPTQKHAKLTALEQSLKRYVAQAHERKLAVHALAGDTTWGLPTHAYIPKLYVEFVQRYNRTAAPNEKLEGLQFDIETYNHESFANNKKAVLTSYLRSVRDTVAHFQALKADFMLGYALPYWFDNENDNIPLITHNKKTAPVAYHVFDILQTIPNSYAVLMDYRNTVEGADGSVAHAKNEIVYTAKYTPGVKLVIAQETTDVEPAKITFHGKPREELFVALGRLSASFAAYPTFHGVAVHDTTGFRALVR